MAVRLKKTKTEWMQEIVQEYIESGQPWPAEKKVIAKWAIEQGKWEQQKKTAIELCAQELADAMRLEMVKDPQGRSVRAKHCAMIEEIDSSGEKVQKYLWFGMDAPPDLMRRSLQQRRKAALGEVLQMNTDRESYNDNNPYGAFIQMSFDFDKDIEEFKHSTEYAPPAIDDINFDED
ncbi:hypothetical protein [Gimesia maris]|uniref:hypothetical protein n=1 Tax=Gimesia maris TaxID=122 RepID=UPI003A952756